MGDSNVESSNLARKLLKIDGNPRVNLLRGSSKGNDASKPSSSSRNPVRGAAITSTMVINPKIDDQTTNVLGDPANVGVLHTAKGNAHDPANVGVLHTAKGTHDPANVGAHPAGIELHTTKGNVHDPAKGNAHDQANVGVRPAMGELHTAKGNVHDPANVVPHTAKPHTAGVNTDNTSVIHESNDGNSYADMARKSGTD
ncbi:hypothetical protein QVD17_16724 [Tagetes erecta]|uniref:Uncharacterized protein n=1 Tax=Tagetes erecta TaxID=13708 RepID=A0AAD8KR93_TARER|nr:hypothetical protein QVD17_16724 [Tagetes erecta]